MNFSDILISKIVFENQSSIGQPGFSLTEEPNFKVEIGEESDTLGILVLENTIQAMVLPKVASPQDNMEIKNPGLMVYDTVNWRFSMVLFGGFGDLRI